MLRIILQRLLKIGQMLAIINASVADDVDGEEAVLVFGRDGLDDEGLVHDAPHGDGVVAGGEDEVAEGGGADRGAGEEVGEGYVALGWWLVGGLWGLGGGVEGIGGKVIRVGRWGDSSSRCEEGAEM